MLQESSTTPAEGVGAEGEPQPQGPEEAQASERHIPGMRMLSQGVAAGRGLFQRGISTLSGALSPQPQPHPDADGDADGALHEAQPSEGLADEKAQGDAVESEKKGSYLSSVQSALQTGAQTVRKYSAVASEKISTVYVETVQPRVEVVSTTTKHVAGNAITATKNAAGSAMTTIAESSKFAFETAKTTIQTQTQKLTSSAKTDSDASHFDNIMQLEGAISLNIPPLSIHTQVFFVSKSCQIVWRWCVKNHDLGFAVRLRKQEIGGAVEEDIRPVARFDPDQDIQGSWMSPDGQDHTVVLAWDNRFSKLRSKSIVYLVQVLPRDVVINIPVSVAAEDTKVTESFVDDAPQQASAAPVPIAQPVTADLLDLPATATAAAPITAVETDAFGDATFSM